MSIVDDPTSRHRRGDHATSKQAAKTVSWKATSQALQLLYAWGANPEGLTDEEACANAGVNVFSCWWKRAGELRTQGLIRWHPEGLTRAGGSGTQRKVSVITESGKRELRSMGARI